MAKILNVAVVGAGTIAQAVHLPILRRRWDRFRIAALVDISPRRRREASEVFGVAEDLRYEDVEQMMEAVKARTLALDLVVLAADGVHVPDVLRIIRRGIPVLVEPPLAFSAEELREIQQFERMAGRTLVIAAYAQQYDETVQRLPELLQRRDVRMFEHEVRMPANAAMYGHAHVTSSSYDLPSSLRAERRSALQAAVEAGSGEGATQRDRDLYVKGLLTGLAYQLALLEATFGPLERLVAVRHWPKGVIPGSIEVLGELEGEVPVRLVWHYLPFSPDYGETVRVLTARKRVQLDLPPVSQIDARSELFLRQKEKGTFRGTVENAAVSAAEAMWDDLHTSLVKGRPLRSGTESAARQVVLLREILARIVEADGRSLEADPEAESPTEATAEGEAEPETEATAEADVPTENESDAEPEAEVSAEADGPTED
ncbi:MAG: Gfo/Idh/MocA family oxidoreductase, partial [Brachybacterium sp.]|nr:Gfo/Idh/MocA family oxidoreductase [Brachybacterium sp.]